jgi:hypothetical protein
VVDVHEDRSSSLRRAVMKHQLPSINPFDVPVYNTAAERGISIIGRQFATLGPDPRCEARSAVRY